MEFPDDGKLAAKLRLYDAWLGLGEQALLFAILALVALIGTLQAFHLGPAIKTSYLLIRDGVYAIALLGAAFAAHQQRLLAMDLVSRRLKPRGRLYLRIALGLFTIFIVVLLLRSGYHLTKNVASEKSKGELIPEWVPPLLIPLASGLIIVHTAVQIVIDAEYLVRGKLPPERQRSAH